MASMKLRVRAASGGPTTRVQVPLLCTLQGLKDVLGPLISLPASSFTLSLNKKDEIQGPGGILLSSFGVTSGDLLYYIVNARRSPSPIQLLPSHVAAENGTDDEFPSRAARPSSVGGRASEPLVDAAGGGRPTSNPNTRRELCASAAARRAATFATEKPREDRMAGSDSSSVDEDQKITTSAETVVSLLPPDPPAAPPAAAMPLGAISSSPAQGGAVMEFESDETAPLEMLPRGGGGHRLIPIPDLLQRVLATELENIRQPSMFLVLAVHAVMLETGFIRVDTGRTDDTTRSGSLTVEGYELPSGWSEEGLVNLTYTLPELSRARESSSSTGRELGEEALLRCQVVGNAVVVYGAVTGGSVHRLCLSISKFLHANVKLRSFGTGEASSSSRSGNKPDSESVVMEDTEPGVGARVRDGARVPAAAAVTASIGENSGESFFRNIFDLWKEVKDCLSLPLMTFMCEKAGLPPPPSLLRLPTELKIKVLDSLRAVALANLSCACSELRFLASNDELWKQKYKEEFGASGDKAPGGYGWRSAFVHEFELRKRREENRREAERRFLAEVFAPGTILRPPSFSHFGGMDFFQMGPGPAHFPGGFRIRRAPSNNAAFPSNWAASGGHDVGMGDRDGGFRGDSRNGWSVLHPLPTVNNLGTRGRSGFGRMDGNDIGSGGQLMEHSHGLDGGDFRGLGGPSA